MDFIDVEGAGDDIEFKEFARVFAADDVMNLGALAQKDTRLENMMHKLVGLA